MNGTSQNQAFPWSLFAIVVIITGVAGGIIWQISKHKEEANQVQAPIVSAPTPVAEEPAPSEPESEPVATEGDDNDNSASDVSAPAKQVEKLVSLDASDADFDAYLGQGPAAQLAKWLVSEHKIRKLVRAVNALEEGKLVSQYRPIEKPETPFKADKDGEQWQLSPANFPRYEPYIAALEQVGAKPLVAIYRHYSPLFEEAFQELGTKKGKFDKVLRAALQRVIDVPQAAGPAALTSTSVLYHYQDKAVEQLPGLNKLLIRMGPQNQSRVQVFAQQFLQALDE